MPNSFMGTGTILLLNLNISSVCKSPCRHVMWRDNTVVILRLPNNVSGTACMSRDVYLYKPFMNKTNLKQMWT